MTERVDHLTLPLISNGERETLDVRVVEGIGGPLAEVSQTPQARVYEAIETARKVGFEALQDLPVRELLDRIADAGRRFESIGADTDTLKPRSVYEDRTARSTGLPVGWVRVSAHWLGYGLRHAAESLRAQSPTAGLNVYDDPAYKRETTVGLSFIPRIRVLGAVMPGNDPAVYAWPVLALAMKVPIVLRPSWRDPFTAVRLARALLAAGIPESAIHVLPGPHDVGETVVRRSDHTLLFGSEQAVDNYCDDPTVEAHGPGRSVAIVTRQPTERELNTLARGVTRTGGRACYNLTRVVAVEDCDANDLANALAYRVADTTDGPVVNNETDVPSFPDTERARRVNERADDAGEDHTARYRNGSRYTAYDNHVRLAPTILRSSSLVDELPFQFAGISQRDPDHPRDLLKELDRAHLGVVVGSESYEEAFARSPRIRKVYANTYPPAPDLRETHETFLADFCYTTTTYDPS